MKIAAIGLTHDHIYGQVNCLLRAGADLAAFHATDETLAAAFAQAFPQAKRVADPARDPRGRRSSPSSLTSAIPAERAAIALAAMRHGKDVMLDKPGMTTLDQLAELRRVQAETGRIFSASSTPSISRCRATVRAGELVAEGAIGEVVHTTGLGPHRLRNTDPRRPTSSTAPRYGGILTDIASHQVEQFLFFTGDREAERPLRLGRQPRQPGAPGPAGRRRHAPRHRPRHRHDPRRLVHPRRPADLGRRPADPRRHRRARSSSASTSTSPGRPGTDHLFLTDSSGVRHIDCAGTDLPFGRQFLADVRDRTETAMPQARTFKAMEIALKAQMLAEESGQWRVA